VSLVKPSMLSALGVPRASNASPLIMPGRKSLGGSAANSSSNSGAAANGGEGGFKKDPCVTNLMLLKESHVSPVGEAAHS